MQISNKFYLTFIFVMFLYLLSAQISFIENTIAENFEEPWSVFPVNMDGDIDILSTAQYANKVSLWENQLLTHAEDNSIFELKNSCSIRNYPNPFNPSTIISFEISEMNIETVNIEIYNLKGQKIKTITPSLCHPKPAEG